jgi:hypothetical protein
VLSSPQRPSVPCLAKGSRSSGRCETAAPTANHRAQLGYILEETAKHRVALPAAAEPHRCRHPTVAIAAVVLLALPEGDLLLLPGCHPRSGSASSFAFAFAFAVASASLVVIPEGDLLLLLLLPLLLLLLLWLSSPKGICFFLRPCLCLCLCFCFCLCRCFCFFGCHPRRGSAFSFAFAFASAPVSFCCHPERSEGPRYPPHHRYRGHLSTQAPAFPPSSEKSRNLSTLATHFSTFYRTFSRKISCFQP